VRRLVDIRYRVVPGKGASKGLWHRQRGLQDLCAESGNCDKVEEGERLHGKQDRTAG